MKCYPIPVTVAQAGTTTTTSAIKLTGVLRGVGVAAPAISGITYTVTIKDKYNNTIFSRTI